MYNWKNIHTVAMKKHDVAQCIYLQNKGAQNQFTRKGI